MSNNQVSYCFCQEYEINQAKEAVNKIFSSFPNLEEKLRSKPGINILIKPNLLAPRHPDKAVTTHPIVLKALIEYLKQYDCNITIADSPAGKYDVKSLEKLYKTCGIDEMAKELGCNLNFDTSQEYVSFPEGKVIKKWNQSINYNHKSYNYVD